MSTTFPHLYKRRKDGKLHKWMIWAKKDILWKQDHIVGGKLKEPIGKLCNSTNIGKSNERTPQQQAIIEANRTWIKMLDKGYTPDPSDTQGGDLYHQVMTAKSQSGFRNYDIIGKAKGISLNNTNETKISRYFPMLAMEWSKKKSKIDLTLGAFAQPKVDGVRCVARLYESKVILTSRTGKEFLHFNHIKRVLLSIFQITPNMILDGELYTHALKIDGQTYDKTERWELISGICSVSRKEPHPQEKIISLYVFDLYDTSGKFSQEERFEAIDEIFRNWKIMNSQTYPVIKLSTLVVHSEEEIMKLHDEWIADSYEGVIIRSRESKYLPGPTKRSEFLLKYKIFDTDEFTIIDAKEGRSTEKGCVIWICKTKEGNSFACRPQGNKKQRQIWWNNYTDFLGKDLTVRYQGTDPTTHIPRFPVGIDIDRWTKE